MNVLRTTLLLVTIPTMIGFDWVAMGFLADNLKAKAGPPHEWAKVLVTVYVAFGITTLWFAVLLWR